MGRYIADSRNLLGTVRALTRRRTRPSAPERVSSDSTAREPDQHHELGEAKATRRHPGSQPAVRAVRRLSPSLDRVALLTDGDADRRAQHLDAGRDAAGH